MDAALQEAEDRWWADFERGLILDPDAPDDRPAERPVTSGGPADPVPPGSGWWAAADRAVDDASAAAHQAQQAVAHAQRLGRTAQRADAADEAAWQAGPGGRVDAARDALAALAAAADSDRRTLAALLSRTAGGGLIMPAGLSAVSWAAR